MLMPAAFERGQPSRAGMRDDVDRAAIMGWRGYLCTFDATDRPECCRQAVVSGSDEPRLGGLEQARADTRLVGPWANKGAGLVSTGIDLAGNTGFR
jgi:hypothetical protein